jgi:TetR/AcrR family transcriptional regulator
MLINQMVKPPGKTGADTKARILAAADAVFMRRGIDGARMQEIADRAGVNKALLHYHFRSKDDLARAVWLRIASSFLPHIFETMASDAALGGKIDQFVDAYLTRLKRHPYIPAYVLGETARRPELVSALFSSGRGAAARRMVRKLREQIAEEVGKGSMAQVTAEQFMATLVGACVFPFAARPLIAAALGVGPRSFDAFIERRRKELPAFLKRGLRP